MLGTIYEGVHCILWIDGSCVLCSLYGKEYNDVVMMKVFPPITPSSSSQPIIRNQGSSSRGNQGTTNRGNQGSTNRGTRGALAGGTRGALAGGTRGALAGAPGEH